MTTKRYISFLAIAGILASMIMAGPVSAKSDGNKGSSRDIAEAKTIQGTMGKVTAISGSTITMTNRGITYTVNATGVTATKSGTAYTLAVGDSIVVQGTVNPTPVTATAIQYRASDDQENSSSPNTVYGKVTAISGSTITMTNRGITYTVNGTGVTATKNGSSYTVIVGDTIAVQGTINPTPLRATAIQFIVSGDQGETDRNSIYGTVTIINSTTITMTSKQNPDGDGREPAEKITTYAVDASKATVTENGKASTLADIKVGDTIVVRGDVVGTKITATSIQNNQGQGQGQIQGTGEPIISGTVTAVNSTSMSITITNKSNTAYIVDTTTAKIKKNNADAAFANIAVGDTVVVQGTFTGTSVKASTIIDQSTINPGNQRVRGGNIFSSFFNSLKRLFGF